MNLVVDANVAFRAMISRHGNIRSILRPGDEVNLYAPKHLFVELFKHKNQIMRATELSETVVLESLRTLLEKVHFIDESSIAIGTWLEAWRLCRNVDEKDTPYVALTLSLNDCLLWSYDEELRNGLKIQGWNRFYPSNADSIH